MALLVTWLLQIERGITAEVCGLGRWRMEILYGVRYFTLLYLFVRIVAKTRHNSTVFAIRYTHTQRDRVPNPSSMLSAERVMVSPRLHAAAATPTDRRQRRCA